MSSLRIVTAQNQVADLKLEKLPSGEFAMAVSGSGFSNVTEALRDAAELWPNPTLWGEPVIASGDIVSSRGNTAGAGWIEISKSPFNEDTETVITLNPRFKMPMKLTTMVSMTHRNAGEQIFSQEMVSDDASYGGEPVPDPIPVEILDASQAATAITINFATAPAVPFRVGQVVSVYGFVDTRLNVNSATVASTPTPTQITLVGNDYTFASTTISTTPGNGTAFVERIDLLGGARNGLAVVHGSATPTQRRFYARSQASTARPSGTLAGAHAVTTGTDASTALAGSAPYSESWGAPLETVFFASQDGLIVADRATDASGNLSGRYASSQVVPNPLREYMLRFRVRNTPGLTRPLAKIVSIVKSGSTTATVTTDKPHGLTTGQYVGFFGVRDQTNFANQTSGVACTVTGTDTFTITHGSAATATSYGGFIVRFNGQQPLGGVVAQVAINVSRTANVVTVTGNATWAAPIAVGNLVEAIGLRDNTTGADLGLDGTYVVRNVATSTLILEPLEGYGPTGADIASVACGGGFVQRLGVRIHSLAAMDYQPVLIDPATKGVSNGSEVQAVSVVTMPTSTGVQGAQANNSSTTPQPILTSSIGVTSNPAAGSAGRHQQSIGTLIGVPIVKPYAIPEAGWTSTVSLTTTTAAALALAAGTGLKRHITALQAINTGASAVDLIILDGTTERWRLPLPPNVPVAFPFPTELLTTANTALNVNLSAASTVRVNAQGYTAP